MCRLCLRNPCVKSCPNYIPKKPSITVPYVEMEYTMEKNTLKI